MDQTGRPIVEGIREGLFGMPEDEVAFRAPLKPNNFSRLRRIREGQCKRCGTTVTPQWWKCCPEHCTEQGPDKVCEACRVYLHLDSVIGDILAHRPIGKIVEMRSTAEGLEAKMFITDPAARKYLGLDPS